MFLKTMQKQIALRTFNLQFLIKHNLLLHSLRHQVLLLAWFQAQVQWIKAHQVLHVQQKIKEEIQNVLKLQNLEVKFEVNQLSRTFKLQERKLELHSSLSMMVLQSNQKSMKISRKQNEHFEIQSSTRTQLSSTMSHYPRQ